MKNAQFIFFFAFFLLLSSLCFGQTNFKIGISPLLQPILQVETFVAKRHSLAISTSGFYVEKRRGLRLDLEYRYYAESTPTFGLYVAPYLRAKYYEDRTGGIGGMFFYSKSDYSTLKFPILGVCTGVNIRTKKWLTFEVFAGAGYALKKTVLTDNYSTETDYFTSPYNRIDLRGGVLVGYMSKKGRVKV